MTLVERLGGQIQGGVSTLRNSPWCSYFREAAARCKAIKTVGPWGGLVRVRRRRAEGRYDLQPRRQGNSRSSQLLFNDLGKGKGVLYEGLFECPSLPEVDGADKDRSPRKIIVLNLVRVSTAVLSERVDDSADANLPTSPPASLDDLRKSACAATDNSPRLDPGPRKRRLRSL